MIKAKNGKVTVKGDVARVLTDFHHITRAVIDVMLKNGASKEVAESMISHNVEMALHPERIEEIMLARVKEIMDRFFSLMNSTDGDKTCGDTEEEKKEEGSDDLSTK